MVSAGAACSSGKVGPTNVQAMGAGPEIAGCTIRISLGWSTMEAEIDHFLTAWTAMCRRVSGGAARAA
jgi:cysteine desulfurase